MINAVLYKLRLKKRPDTPFDRERILSALPLRNQLIKWEVDDKEEVSLVIPQQQKLWIRIASKIFSLPDKRVIVLDDVGSYVWRLCDGKTSISQIVKHLSKQYRMTRKGGGNIAVYFHAAVGQTQHYRICRFQKYKRRGEIDGSTPSDRYREQCFPSRI